MLEVSLSLPETPGSIAQQSSRATITSMFVVPLNCLRLSCRRREGLLFGDLVVSLRNS